MTKQWLGGWIGLVATLAVATPVAADTHGDLDVSRLIRSHETERYNVAFPGQSIRAGGGRTMVNAPIDVVRRVVVDYGHYADFIPRFQKSQVLGPKNGGTAVFLRVPILHGVATIYAVTRFDPPKAVADEELVEGSLDGQSNVDQLHAVWHMKRIDDKHTLLRLEMLIVPKFPVPGSVVTGELEFAADQAVSGTRDRAESIAGAQSNKNP
jgi:hypothetical protein